MRAIRFILLYIISLLLVTNCNSSTGSDKKESENLLENTHTFTSLEDAYPTYSAQDQIIEHYAYSLKYNEEYEQADWVIYFLSSSHLNGTQNRTDNFREDKAITTGSASLEDYSGSGYDRGHLAPAGDMTWSYDAMSESFYLSNMSPQEPGFNRGIWKTLESYVRTWAAENGEIYVVTGPVLKGTLKTIGPSKVGVPEFFYKVILDYKEPEQKGIGFVLRNESSELPLQTFAVTIDSVESFTGIDFFPAIPDSIEKIIESSVVIGEWSFTASYQEDDTSADNDPGEDQSKIIVYITETGSKYHRDGCRYLSESKISISLKDAKARGYTPCSVCKPPE